MESEKIPELAGFIGKDETVTWIEVLKGCELLEKISDITAVKKFIDEVFIPKLQRISWELDTVINKDKINKMLADSSQLN